jgi:hypothetical protein
MFLADEAKTPVILPLEEVLKNLPATVLKLREDQEQLQLDSEFETPFSMKAKEDAERFAPAKANREAAEEKTTAPAAVESKPEEAKQAEVVDPKKIIEEALGLAGVAACIAMFSDGLTLAGDLPEELEAGGLCAIAPSFLARMDEHMRASKLGELVTLTVHSAAEKGMSFFAKGNICLVAVHAADALTSDTRGKLAQLARKLSANYAKPE